MTISLEQRKAVVAVFAQYMDNGHDYWQRSEKTWGEVLADLSKSSVGPGPDFFPALELALSQQHHTSCEHVVQSGRCLNCSYPN